MGKTVLLQQITYTAKQWNRPNSDLRLSIFYIYTCPYTIVTIITYSCPYSPWVVYHVYHGYFYAVYNCEMRNSRTRSQDT